MSEKSWYLIQYKPNSYRIAKLNLERQGFDTFIPMQKITKRINSKFVDFIYPLFKGYFFVAFDHRRSEWTKINSTIGVIKIICQGQKPIPVPEDIINGIKLRCDNDDKIINKKKFKAGDCIKIIRGPFSGFVGNVEEIKDEVRISTLLNYMGNQINVSVNGKMVELLN